MPGFIQDQLQLTDTQRQQLATLQSGVDAQLLQILTTQQIQQLAAGPQNFGNGNGAKGSDVKDVRRRILSKQIRTFCEN